MDDDMDNFMEIDTEHDMEHDVEHVMDNGMKKDMETGTICVVGAFSFSLGMREKWKVRYSRAAVKPMWECPKISPT